MEVMLDVAAVFRIGEQGCKCVSSAWRLSSYSVRDECACFACPVRNSGGRGVDRQTQASFALSATHNTHPYTPHTHQDRTPRVAGDEQEPDPSRRGQKQRRKSRNCAACCEAPSKEARKQGSDGQDDHKHPQHATVSERTLETCKADYSLAHRCLNSA